MQTANRVDIMVTIERMAGMMVGISIYKLDLRYKCTGGLC